MMKKHPLTHTLAKILSITVCVVLSGSMAMADDILDNLDAARKSYTEKQYKDVEDILSKTLGLLKEKRKEMLMSFLPKPLEGFTQEVVETPPLPPFMAGLGLQVDARYTKDNEVVSLSILLDSPLNRQYQDFISKPEEVAKAANISLFEHKGYMGTQRKTDKSYEVNLILNDSLMVIARGENVSDKSVVTQLDKIEFRKLIEAFSSAKKE